MTQRDDYQRENRDQGRDMASRAYTSKFACQDGKPLSICVVEAVAEASETDPRDLRPLYETLDPDSLNQLFESPPDSRTGRITFIFEGCRVTVDTEGLIAVSHEMNEGE